MIAKLLISPQLEVRVDGIEKILTKARLKKSHPDVLYFEYDSKLGIEQIRQIKEYLSLKPFQADSKAVVMEEAENLTIEAQNAILKTLEELPNNALFILSANTDSKLLPTIMSRCQIIHLDPKPLLSTSNMEKLWDDLRILTEASIEERFEYVENLDDKKEFLIFLTQAFRRFLLNKSNPSNDTIVQVYDLKEAKDFLEELLIAEKWAAQNVNIRAILEYLMLKMPLGHK